MTFHPWLDGGTHSSDHIPAVAAWILQHTSGSVLDAGCGNGDLFRLLVGRECRGIDIEPSHARLAAQRTGVSVDIGDFLRYDFGERVGNASGQTFGVVCCLNWLHNDWRNKHAINCERRHEAVSDIAQRAFAAARWILDDGGILIYDWPSADAPLPGGFELVERIQAKRWVTAWRKRPDAPPEPSR